MTSSHTSYEDLASQRRDSDYRHGHAEAQRAYLIGKAVRERRLALGLSQVELASRASMTQPALSRLEAGGVIPTIPLLDRISAALDADPERRDLIGDRRERHKRGAPHRAHQSCTSGQRGPRRSQRKQMVGLDLLLGRVQALGVIGIHTATLSASERLTSW